MVAGLSSRRSPVQIWWVSSAPSVGITFGHRGPARTLASRIATRCDPPERSARGGGSLKNRDPAGLLTREAISHRTSPSRTPKRTRKVERYQLLAAAKDIYEEMDRRSDAPADRERERQRSWQGHRGRCRWHARREAAAKIADDEDREFLELSI